MGNCVRRCFGVSKRTQRYLRTRYGVENDLSIEEKFIPSALEFQNLMNEDEALDEHSRLVTDNEKQMLLTKKYTDLVHEQKRIDREIDLKLAQEEEELRQEEEKFLEAKREAARIAKKRKAKEAESSKQLANGKAWLGGDANDWDVANGPDEFETYLANVKAKSLQATAQLVQSDNQSSNSSSVGANTNRDRSNTEGSSLDLEWEHEEGMSSQRRSRSATDDSLVHNAIVHKSSENSMNSDEFEWDNEYVTAEGLTDSQQLLAAEKTIEKFPS